MSPSRSLLHAKRFYRSLPGVWPGGMDLYLRRRCAERPPARLNVMTSLAGPDLDVVQVLLLSLSEAHPRDHIDFWLFEQTAPKDQIAGLADFCATLGNITLRPINVPLDADFERLKALGGKPDSARFLWFVAHRHLPPELDRIIYLDALDVIVMDDLVPLLRHPFMGRYLVACREALDVPPLLVGPAPRAHRRGLPAALVEHVSRGLINSGVIVLNLRKFRRDGIRIGQYVEVAEWAQGTLGLKFGDQGLFSLTHGSHYARAHDRYNHRFADEAADRPMKRPAVIHYAGKVIKPARFRLLPWQEDLVIRRIRDSASDVLRLDRIRQMRAAHVPYLRRWWDICARTPSHARIAPLAERRMADALKQAGLL
ncbi:glycosyltransferase family 8 protein [Paracoccus angustae]|uniref:Glycosyltransferase family 8 protein n=1 Tax=Paracoccus angustae TaxID=1671480 RepID=A0ABV7U4N1_9RHOB